MYPLVESPLTLPDLARHWSLGSKSFESYCMNVLMSGFWLGRLRASSNREILGDFVIKFSEHPGLLIVDFDAPPGLPPQLDVDGSCEIDPRVRVRVPRDGIASKSNAITFSTALAALRS